MLTASQPDAQHDKQVYRNGISSALLELDRLDLNQYHMSIDDKQQAYDSLIRFAGMMALNLFGPRIRFHVSEFYSTRHSSFPHQPLPPPARPNGEILL